MNSIDGAWTDLLASLDRLGRALHEEVCHYPTPIARCDVQLTWAIERRAAAFAHLRKAEEVDGMRPRISEDEWRRRIGDFACALGDGDDVGVTAARDRLFAALGN